MEIPEIIRALRRNMVETGSLVCVGCGREHNCSIHGCAIMREAANALEALNRRAAPENKRLIDAAALTEEIQHLQIFLAGKSLFTPEIKETVLRTIDEQPTITAAPENKPLTPDELKVENAQLRAVITVSDPDFFKRKCRICGCDWNHPCNDHDYWVEDDLCSACARKPEGSENE